MKEEKNKVNRHEIGTFGENAAIDYLKQNNFHIIDRNFRFGRLGEIDIIARNGEYICFIEVKSRTGVGYGAPSEAVTRKKQDTIRKIAQVYLMGKRQLNCAMRFDVVEVMIKKSSDSISVSQINLIENAF